MYIAIVKEKIKLSNNFINMDLQIHLVKEKFAFTDLFHYVHCLFVY